MQHDKENKQVILSPEEQMLLGEEQPTIDERLAVFAVVKARHVERSKLTELVELYREAGIEEYSENNDDTLRMRKELEERTVLLQELQSVVDELAENYPEITIDLPR